MQNPNSRLFLNPHWLAEIGAKPCPNRFVVYAVAYPDNAGNRRVRVWYHKTLRAAGKRIGSAIRGNLAMRNDSAVFAIEPNGTIHNWHTANGKA